jgi:hypothetical protein
VVGALPGNAAAYRLSGDFVELCDCYSVCPCWIGLDPDEDRCTGVFGWAIDSGEVGGVDVSGRRVVSVSFHAGHRNTGDQRVSVFVDEGASDGQFDTLVALFTGDLGGPLGELRRLMGSLLSAERAPIAVEVAGRTMSITVGRRVSGDGTILTGADGETTELRHGRLSNVLGPRADVGVSSTLSVQLPDIGSVEVRSRSAMRGSFTYEHDGS